MPIVPKDYTGVGAVGSYGVDPPQRNKETEFNNPGTSSAILIDGFKVANFLVLSQKIEGFPNPVLKIDGFPNSVLKIDGFLGTQEPMLTRLLYPVIVLRFYFKMRFRNLGKCF